MVTASLFICQVVVYTYIYIYTVFLYKLSQNLNDLEQAELDEELGPLPSNILDPPIWSHDLPHPLGGGGGSCGPWQKSYTHMHRGKVGVLIKVGHRRRKQGATRFDSVTKSRPRVK